MSKLWLSVCLAFAFFVTSAVAQTAGAAGSQGTQSSSPSMSGDRQGQAGTGQMGTDQTGNQNSQSNGERTIKGCVQSQGSSYVLETKKGKDIALSGQDVSAHVGHEVALKGTFESGNGMSSTASSNGGHAEKTFNVTSVKHISPTCKGSKTNSGSMGNSGSSSQGTGTSTTPSNQPPQ